MNNKGTEPPQHDAWSRWAAGRLIRAVFQPIVSLRDGSVLAFEGLSRPHGADGTSIDVSALIASAEQHDELLAFDDAAFRAVLASAASLAYGPELLLFINILPKSLEHPLPFLRHLQHHPLITPQQMVLEISERETISGGDAKLQEYLAPFREMGVRVALDDLGSGYSGLNRLVELSPDFAKIDLSLVRDVDRNSIKLALLESTARFATNTAATVLIAEGIESFAELYTLKEIGVDYGQGYLLGRPLDHLASALESPQFSKGKVRSLSPQYQLDSLLTSARRMVQGLARGEGRYTHLLALAKRLTGADVAALYKADGPGLRYFESTVLLDAEEIAHFNRVIDTQSSALYAAMLRRKPAIFQRASDREPGVWSERHHLESRLAVPICDNLGCWGMLHLGYHEPDQIRPGVIQLAEGIASLFALALGYAEREESLADQALLGEPLFEAISALADTDSLERLLAKAVEAAMAATGAHEGWIGILNAQCLHCVLADGHSFDIERELLFDPSTDDGQGPVGKILQRQKALIIPNIANDPSLNPWMEEMLASGIKSAAGLPLISQGRLLGILKVYHSEIGGFTPGRIRRLHALASLATALIERSLSTLASEDYGRRQRVIAQGFAAMNYLHSSKDLIDLLVSILAEYGPYPLVSVIQDRTGIFVPLAVHAETDSLREEFRQGISTAPYLDVFSLALKTGQTQSLKPAPGRSRQSGEPVSGGPACCTVIPLKVHGLLAVIGAGQPGSLLSYASDIETYIHSLGAALDHNMLQDTIAEAQQETERLLATIKTLPLASTTQELWKQVGTVLITHLRATGGWLTEQTQPPRVLAEFGPVRAPKDVIPPALLTAISPVAVSGEDVPAELRRAGTKSLAGFRLYWPERVPARFLIITGDSPDGFSSSQMRRFEILVSFAQASYEILQLRSTARDRG